MTVGEDASAGKVSRWRSPARLAVLAVVASLLGLLAWATLAAGEGRSFVAGVAAGERPLAPVFDVEAIWPEGRRWPPELARDLTDGRLSVDELRGSPVILNFWASWCLPCRDEAPILADSARAHAGEAVFVGVDVQDFRSDALAFLREFDAPYVSLRDEGDKTYSAYGLTGVPETFYVDARGRVVSHSPGAISRASLEQGIQAALSSR